jgi:hypothetical protein
LTIVFGTDLKSGTMTQSGHHGDVVVKFTGIWEGATLHAVTAEVVSDATGVKWEPESFTLRFGEDGNSANYECVADGKSGTMTQSSRSGDTVVRFDGEWDGESLRAVTNDVISKPANIEWTPESFTLRFTEDGKRGSYEIATAEGISTKPNCFHHENHDLTTTICSYARRCLALGHG